MLKHRAQLISLWLLPVLVMRALVPAGYMLDVSRGSAAVVMCSENFDTRTDHSRFGDSTIPQGGQHNSNEHSICPFALALGVALPAETSITLASTFSFATFDHDAAIHVSPFGPSRINLTRGPPARA